MLRKIAVTLPLLATAIIVPAYSQSTDPRASDGAGNGPPAVVMTPKSGDQQSETKDEKKRAAAERPLTGVVTDAEGNPMKDAIVQLKNMRTLQIRSFITREKGDYYFSGLNKDVDYEVKATFSGKSSPTRTLSSFDTKTQPVLNLQIK